MTAGTCFWSWHDGLPWLVGGENAPCKLLSSGRSYLSFIAIENTEKATAITLCGTFPVAHISPGIVTSLWYAALIDGGVSFGAAIGLNLVGVVFHSFCLSLICLFCLGVSISILGSTHTPISDAYSSMSLPGQSLSITEE